MKPAAEVIDVTFCDQVRREDNGKLLILGVYINKVIVAGIPCRIPSFAFVVKWRIRSGWMPNGSYAVRAPSGNVLVNAEVRLERPGVTPGPGEVIAVMGIHQLSPFVFEELGRYRLTFSRPGSRARTIATFDVELPPQLRQDIGQAESQSERPV
ncbi:MAG TPA: carboxypeptidase-like regulatory domain-containing protein [Thermoanaerobaculaceae bacterium]|nr:carboxypeptidase-like regulatory domain-containing protein [Thermoanaerobaculaceae bacterium]